MLLLDDLDFSDGQIVDWDDGHVPETILDRPTRLVVYPSSRQVHCVDHAVDPALVDALYDFTSQRALPWGTYVTKEAVEDVWKVEEESRAVANDYGSEMDRLATRVTASVLRTALHEASDWFTTWPSTHGVAVWALRSSVGSYVPYHLDYAEQIRYRTNLIVPPRLAGTLQCTKTPLEGGAFEIHEEGLDHYRKYGYKAENVPSARCIPYRYNRLILQSGDLPHSSTQVTALQEGSYRVIVGFNVFGHDVGPTVQQAPEHSEAFRRETQQWTFTQIRQNPVLARSLVQAKRQHERQQFVQRQAQLDAAILQRLPCTVGALIQQLQDDPWPTSPDILIHLHRRQREGLWKLHTESSPLETPLHTLVVESNN